MEGKGEKGEKGERGGGYDLDDDDNDDDIVNARLENINLNKKKGFLSR